MPYIHPTRRGVLEAHPRAAETAGELNFAITSIITSYVHANGPSYHTFNEVIGVLECAKMELYRRVIGKYEDQKIRENGDVYPDFMVGKEGRAAMQDGPFGVSPGAEAVRTNSKGYPPKGAGTAVVHALREVLQTGKFPHALPAAEAELRHPHEFTDAELVDLRTALDARERRFGE